MDELHPYTRKLLTFRALRKAGYPLQADDLELEEWFDLGEMDQQLEAPQAVFVVNSQHR